MYPTKLKKSNNYRYCRIKMGQTKNVLLLPRPKTWAKEKHCDPDLTPEPSLKSTNLWVCLRVDCRISSIPEHRIPWIPDHEIPPIFELAAESGHETPPIPSYPGQLLSHRKSYIKSVSCSDCCCFSPEAVTLLDSSFPINPLSEVCCVVWHLHWSRAQL